MSIAASELILNEDGSIYHLGLHPEQVYPTIITVGDPDRVEIVSKYFDRIDFKKQKREFISHGGRIGNRDITVVSTGIGTDNVDIVINELDALVNIDLDTRTPKSDIRKLDIMRLGTSGTIRAEVEVDSLVLSRGAIGMDGLMHFYKRDKKPEELEMLTWEINWPLPPYYYSGSESLLARYTYHGIEGITVSNTGFYGPQSRRLRLDPASDNLFETLAGQSINGCPVTNLEMETSGIYGLCQLLGHNCLSINVIIANRSLGKFSNAPDKAVINMIETILEEASK